MTKLPPEYGNYSIKRNNKSVVFGCGIVKYTKEELETLANLFEIRKDINKKINKLRVRTIGYVSFKDFNRITPELIKQVIND